MKRYLLVIEAAILHPTYKAVIICFLVIHAGSVQAQQTTVVAEDTAYVRVVHERAGKIVAALAIKDEKKFKQAQDIIASQYRALNQLHEGSKLKVQQLKQNTGLTKEALDESVKQEEADKEANLARQHSVYIDQLKMVLTDEQIEQVKDGMTYRVLPTTYQAHLDMIPSLTEEQKKQIYSWLVEARDHAMDAESSDKKHWWFGKYKGRINNYLAAQGYDLKKEREAWEIRKKEKAAR
ncbi:DUF3826 domain-containing protein [Paraflavitalea sp. CAU 1676]|uniref:DUF3826 domain-containing protein n=1 Tax=Paraflavitalea sp. CAU 1676 TaxID=3032598 RepID=UPI0023DB83CF|nr:DUF3826 domain-containing protein [Paraflavitalea sp. CAU 1676]MDF2190437.1 DUF3826 domain-containing protein [Paraflavitalea sp. CAU 1676]